MSAPRQLEFFLLRYVPDAVKDEFVNIGVVMLERGNGGFADVRFTRDWRRVRCLDPQADVETLQAMEQEVRRNLEAVADRELLIRKMRDSFSNVVQLSPTKGCLAEEPGREIETLASLYLESARGRRRGAVSGRQAILRTMQSAFERAGIWKMLIRQIAVEKYTQPGDPMKIDFGYRVGNEIKMFHAVSLKASIEQAVGLAYRFPKIANGMAESEHAAALLTAVLDDDLNKSREDVAFALTTLKENRMQFVARAEMDSVAERARVDLTGG